MIYLDNAATSWPKPPCVAEAMMEFMNKVGASPGRSAHRLSVDSGRLLYDAREAVAELFGAPDPLRVVFTLNGTEALNLALHGLLYPGAHVITSGMEHNSMMRPLRALERQGVEVTVIPCSPDGKLNAADVGKAIKAETVLIAMNHASNVVGTTQRLAQIAAVARRSGVLLLLDAAQSAGAFPIDMEKDSIDLLAFTGHKSLLGPTGTGGLILGERVDAKRMKPLKQGGTGSNSEHEAQPDFLPDAFEAGTPNVVGLAGLNAAIRWILEQGIDSIRNREVELTQRMIDGLLAIPDVTVYGDLDSTFRTGTVSFNIAGMESSDVGLSLDEEYDIMCRVGLHCAPSAHRTIGTFPAGTVRFALGVFTTETDVDMAVKAVSELAGRR
jgi:cysteine desulfurase / selenocysteine lyase